jgi:hypothetical protein
MDSRDVLATVDKPLTMVLEPLGDGKIRVRTSSWDQEHVILADQVLEAVARRGRWGLRADPIGRPDCGPAPDVATLHPNAAPQPYPSLR